jgi:hypothetical protein
MKYLFIKKGRIVALFEKKGRDDKGEEIMSQAEGQHIEI